MDLVLRKLADGVGVQEILLDYPALTEQTIRACLGYAADVLADEQTVDLVPEPLRCYSHSGGGEFHCRLW